MKNILYIAFLISAISFGQQTARPTADLVVLGSWGSPTWSNVNGVVGSDDGDSVTNNTPTSAEIFAVQCQDLSDPVSAIDHIMRMRVRKTTGGGADYDFVMELRSGYIDEATQGTLLATLSAINQSITTATTFTYTLSAGEANAITDYTKLVFRCYGAKNGGGANRVIEFFDVEFEVPDAPPVTRNRAHLIN